MVEFFEDYYDQNKTEMYDLDLPLGSVGDPVIEKWEREVRAGIMPNLMEDLPPEEAKKVVDWSRKAYKKKVEKGIIKPGTDGNIGARIDELEELLGGGDSYEEEF